MDLRYPLRGFQVQSGRIIHYSEERLEKACQRLLLYSSSPSVRNINSILKNGQDKVSTHTQESVETAQSNDYGLTRGANYYRRRSEQQ